MALKDLNIIEREIIGRFLDRVDALVKEYPETQVSVFDGEEWSHRFIAGYDRAKIEDVVGITEETVFRVRVGKEHSSVFFYHGNYEDVLSDMSDSKDGAWIGDRLTKGLVE